MSKRHDIPAIIRDSTQHDHTIGNVTTNMAYPTLVAKVFDKRGRLLSSGTNFPKKTHPEQARRAAQMGQDYKVFLHAEISALVKIRDGIPYKITVERYGKKGQPLNAKPCPICELAIKEAGIKRIEYTIG